jgi:hypothetical protein
VFSKIFLKAIEIGELLESYQEYLAQSMGKQGGEFLMASLEKIVCRILHQDFKQIICELLGNILLSQWASKESIPDGGANPD